MAHITKNYKSQNARQKLQIIAIMLYLKFIISLCVTETATPYD